MPSPDILLALLIFTAGLYFLLRLRAFFFLHPIRSLRYMLGGERLGSSLSALALALSGTLGVGSISGVALALAVGGPGAILWMWLSVPFAMAVHYAEVTLALGEREAGGWPSRLHALFLLLLAPTLGGALQSSAAAEAVSLALGTPRLSVGILLALAALSLTLLGARGLARASDRLLPFLSLLYLVLTVGVILKNASALPQVFSRILCEAFTPKASAGGLLGCIGTGVSRGLLSNEAGCGTAVYAHAEAKEADPCRQGLFGIAEVGIDTLLFCTLSALALLTVGGETAGDLSSLLSGCRAVFGQIAPLMLALTILCFAFAAAIALLHHGAEALGKLGLGCKRLYAASFSLSLFFGAMIPISGVADFADLLLFAMTCLTLLRIIKAADRVLSLSAAAGLIRFGRKRGSSTAARLRQHTDAQACQAPRARSSDR